MRKRHWYQAYNWSAPLVWVQNGFKLLYKKHKKLCEVIGYIICLLIIVIFAFYQLKTIANERQAEYQKLELKRLEQVAIQKENDIKLRKQQEEQARQKETKDYYNKLQQEAVIDENKMFEKMAKKQYPIGTYIKVVYDDQKWIGKIQSIHGKEITTTDHWKCYFGDEIEYSQYKEYIKFIKDNSKG